MKESRAPTTQTIFDFDDYKKYLSSLPDAQNRSFSWLADQARVHKQYFSRVLNDKAHLSEEQIYGIANGLELGPQETEYFLLLQRESKASWNDYRVKLKAQRQDLRQKVLGLPSHLTKTTKIIEESALQLEYYSDLKIQLIHVLLQLPPSLRPLSLICQWTGLSSSEVQIVLQKLVGWDLCEKRSGQYFAKQSERHLAKGDVLMDQNHRNWRAWQSQRHRRSHQNDLRYSGVVCADADTRLWLIAQVKELLGRAHKRIPQAKEQEVFVVGLDILNVTEDLT